MVYINDFEEFEAAAQELFSQHPLRTAVATLVGRKKRNVRHPKHGILMIPSTMENGRNLKT